MTALLFCDLETTDLDPARLTILEAAWCITDMDGTQRLPLRSRYTEITPLADTTVVPDRYAMGGWRWRNQDSGNSFALAMAQESGLFTDWLACPRGQRLTSPWELQRLILDDLAQACDPGQRNPDWRPSDPPGVLRWLREPERVYLAGMGVAQFDQPVLRVACPAVVADFGRLAPVHYRPGGDVSIAQTALLGDTAEGKLIEWGCAEYGWPEIGSFRLGKPPHCAYGGFPDSGPDDGGFLDSDDWLIGEAKPHRALLDVMRGIAAQRVLWRVGKPLREGLGLEGRG